MTRHRGIPVPENRFLLMQLNPGLSKFAINQGVPSANSFNSNTTSDRSVVAILSLSNISDPLVAGFYILDVLPLKSSHNPNTANSVYHSHFVIQAARSHVPISITVTKSNLKWEAADLL